MSTSGGSEEAVGEVRRRPAPEPVAPEPVAPEPPPMSRREMKARGILLTTEIPVIKEPPGWGGTASVAADLTGAVGASGAPAQLPSRRTLRGNQQEPAVANRSDTSGAQTATGRRPVVRAPLTARGLRTVDESGAITGVHSAIGHAVGRAIESATSPASWESAVSLPAIALGIEDVAGAPTGAGSTTAGQGSDTAPAAEVQAAPAAGAGALGDPGAGARAALTAAGAGPKDATRLEPAEAARAIASPESAEPAEQTGARPTTREAARREAGAHRAQPARTVSDGRLLALKIGAIVAAVAAVGVLIYLVSTGALSSLFAQAPAGPGSSAGTLAVAVGALWRPRSLRPAPADPILEEIRDR